MDDGRGMMTAIGLQKIGILAMVSLAISCGVLVSPAAS